MIIVSLTTTYSRLKLCRNALLSLCHQSTTPDKIILWVSREPYLSDTGISSVPLWFADFREYGNLLEIKWTANTGPYRKLLPVLSICHDDDLIVTADDDIIYGRDWLTKLLLAYNNNPDYAAACRVRKISKNRLGLEKTYIKWAILRKNQILDHDFIITFGGGTVLRKAFFSTTLLTDNNYLQLAKTADDLWFTHLLTDNGTNVNVVADALDELYFIEHHEGLIHRNVFHQTSRWQRLKYRLLTTYLSSSGISACENDVIYKRLKDYFSKP